MYANVTWNIAYKKNQEDTKVLIRIERNIVEEMTGIVRTKEVVVDDVVENEEYYEPLWLT